MNTLNVLCPGGRRQTVKVAPGTTVLKVLEDVCEKQKLSSADFDLKHHRTILDVTSTVRYCGLPNNAQLEVVPVTRVRQSSQVTLAVQDVEGQRHVQDFPPETTLAQVIYRTEETSSKKLWASDDTIPVCVYMQREIAGQEALESTTLKQLGITCGKAVLRLVSRNSDSSREQMHVGGMLAKKEEPKEELPQVQNAIPEENIKVPNSENIRVDSSEKLREVENSKLSNEHSCTTVKLEPRVESSFEAKETFEEIISVETTSSVACEESTQTVEDDSNDVLSPLGSCGGLLYSLDDPTLASYENLGDDLPTNFFDLTIDDAMKLQRDRRRELEELLDAPIQTSEQRALRAEMQKLERLNRYRQAVLKCVLPDRFVLHAAFKPSDTVDTVRSFIRQHLREDLDFVLYTTPPKQHLVTSDTLLDAQLFPSAVVYIGFPDNEFAPFMKESTLANVSTARAVLKEAARLRQESLRNSTVDPALNTQTSAVASQNGQKRAAHSPTSQAPKWFKAGK